MSRSTVVTGRVHSSARRGYRIRHLHPHFSPKRGRPSYSRWFETAQPSPTCDPELRDHVWFIVLNRNHRLGPGNWRPRRSGCFVRGLDGPAGCARGAPFKARSHMVHRPVASRWPFLAFCCNSSVASRGPSASMLTSTSLYTGSRSRHDRTLVSAGMASSGARGDLAVSGWVQPHPPGRAAGERCPQGRARVRSGAARQARFPGSCAGTRNQPFAARMSTAEPP